MTTQILLERWFAKTYGWTPEQVGKLPLENLIWLPIIETAEAKATAMRQKDDSKGSSQRGRVIQGF